MLDLKTKCGFVLILGPVNSGKSTLVNVLTGNKVSIVSPKVHTTRTIIKGIYTDKINQIIFIDTPGIIDNPKKKLEKSMILTTYNSFNDADVCLFMIDSSISEEVNLNYFDLINAKINLSSIPTCLVLNKIDKVKKEKLLGLSKTLNKKNNFINTFMISSLKSDGTNDLLSDLKNKIPFGNWLFNEDDIVDLPERLYTAEITREKIFNNLRDELPYNITVETESWVNKSDGSIKIDQIIYVTRPNHKGIVLGKSGKNLKKIGEDSRRDLENIFGTKVHLYLYVKVDSKWNQKSEYYKTWGINFTKTEI